MKLNFRPELLKFILKKLNILRTLTVGLSAFFKVGTVCLGINCTGYSQDYYFDYNKEVEACYQLAIHLRLDECRVCIKKLKVKQPRNLSITHIENYIDFFEIFIKEEKDYFVEAKSRKTKRLALLDNAPKDNPYYKFAKAEIILQWALARLKFDEKMTAASEIYEAYRLLEQNNKDFPDFVDHHKSLSVIYALAESIPGWVRKLAGIYGSIQLAQSSMEKVLKTAENPNYFFRQEAAAIYAYMLYYQFNQKDEAITVLDRFAFDHRDNPLAAFVKASLYMKSGKNEECLAVLNERPKGKEFLEFYYLDLMRGKSLLYKLDPAAIHDLSLFASEFKGSNYIKEAWQKIAWYRLLIDDNEKMYQYTIDRAARRGTKIIDEDIQAESEAKSGKIPNKTLLKARLLSDGGYCKRALELLQKEKNNFTAHSTETVEYHYRIGRIYQQLKNYDSALKSFELCIAHARDTKAYFPCAASLYMGTIYEEKGENQKAKNAYNACLQLNPKDYKDSLHQKAKSGLQRLN